jgi:hypothetical protein
LSTSSLRCLGGKVGGTSSLRHLLLEHLLLEMPRKSGWHLLRTWWHLLLEHRAPPPWASGGKVGGTSSLAPPPWAPGGKVGGTSSLSGGKGGGTSSLSTSSLRCLGKVGGTSSPAPPPHRHLLRTWAPPPHLVEKWVAPPPHLLLLLEHLLLEMPRKKWVAPPPWGCLGKVGGTSSLGSCARTGKVGGTSSLGAPGKSGWHLLLARGHLLLGDASEKWVAPPTREGTSYAENSLSGRVWTH